jgi:hypothetical protein
MVWAPLAIAAIAAVNLLHTQTHTYMHAYLPLQQLSVPPPPTHPYAGSEAALMASTALQALRRIGEPQEVGPPSPSCWTPATRL